MSLFAQLTVNGLIAGSIYALVASGFSMIFSTNRFMHFAHSTVVVLSGYLTYTFYVFSKALLLTFIPAIVLTSLFGLGIYRAIYLPLQKRGASNVILLVSSISFLIFFQNLIQAIYGASVKSLNYSFQTFTILGASVTALQVLMIDTALILSFFLYIFMRSTRLGRDMRAVSYNKELADVVGINQRRVTDFSFLIGSFLGAIAGVFIGLEQNLTPVMGLSLIIKGFTGAVIGGVTSIPGSVLGSFVLGLTENYGIAFLPSGFKDAIAFFLLFLFLLLRPNGLFGLSKGGQNA